MTSGCGPGWLGGADTSDWSAPLVIQGTSLSCPEADPALRRESKRTVPALQPDAKDAAGKPYVSDDAVKRKFDEFRVSQERKNRALGRALDEHERCRTGGAANAQVASR